MQCFNTVLAQRIDGGEPSITPLLPLEALLVFLSLASRHSAAGDASFDITRDRGNVEVLQSEYISASLWITSSVPLIHDVYDWIHATNSYSNHLLPT